MRYLFFFLLFTLTLSADIISICSLSQVAFIEDDTLVIFDVDDTLIRYPSHLGSECWFIEASQALHFHENAALLAQKLSVIPVEPSVVTLIHSLQRRNILVMGITSRALEHPIIEDWPQKTIRQIASIGIQFSTAPVFDTVLSQTLYLHGVLMVGANSKGAVLSQCIHDISPKQVVLFDDRLSDIKEVEKELRRQNIPFTGYWYRAIEPSRCAYDSEAARKQLDSIKGSR